MPCPNCGGENCGTIIGPAQKVYLCDTGITIPVEVVTNVEIELPTVTVPVCPSQAINDCGNVVVNPQTQEVQALPVAPQGVTKVEICLPSIIPAGCGGEGCGCLDCSDCIVKALPVAIEGGYVDAGICLPEITGVNCAGEDTGMSALPIATLPGTALNVRVCNDVQQYDWEIVCAQSDGRKLILQISRNPGQPIELVLLELDGTVAVGETAISCESDYDIIYQPVCSSGISYTRVDVYLDGVNQNSSYFINQLGAVVPPPVGDITVGYCQGEGSESGAITTASISTVCFVLDGETEVRSGYLEKTYNVTVSPPAILSMNLYDANNALVVSGYSLVNCAEIEQPVVDDYEHTLEPICFVNQAGGVETGYVRTTYLNGVIDSTTYLNSEMSVAANFVSVTNCVDFVEVDCSGLELYPQNNGYQTLYVNADSQSVTAWSPPNHIIDSTLPSDVYLPMTSNYRPVWLFGPGGDDTRPYNSAKVSGFVTNQFADDAVISNITITFKFKVLSHWVDTSVAKNTGLTVGFLNGVSYVPATFTGNYIDNPTNIGDSIAHVILEPVGSDQVFSINMSGLSLTKVDIALSSLCIAVQSGTSIQLSSVDYEIFLADGTSDLLKATPVYDGCANQSLSKIESHLDSIANQAAHVVSERQVAGAYLLVTDASVFDLTDAVVSPTNSSPVAIPASATGAVIEVYSATFDNDDNPVGNLFVGDQYYLPTNNYGRRATHNSVIYLGNIRNEVFKSEELNRFRCIAETGATFELVITYYSRIIS